MCKTFNVIPLLLICPTGVNLTQTKSFTVKSIEGVFTVLLFAYATTVFKVFAIAPVDNFKPHHSDISSLCWSNFSKTVSNVTSLDKTYEINHQRTVHGSATVAASVQLCFAGCQLHQAPAMLSLVERFFCAIFFSYDLFRILTSPLSNL